MDKKILTLDTTTPRLEISFFDGKNLNTLGLNSPKTHTETVLEGVDVLIKMAGCDIKDVDIFGAVIGPGSFTGIRIGLSVIKGFSSAKKIKPVGINALDLIALKNLKLNYRYLGVLTDARKNEVYFKLYEKSEGMMWGVGDYCSLPTHNLKNLVEDRKNTVLIVSGEEVFWAKFFDILSGYNVIYEERRNLTEILVHEIIKKLKEGKIGEIKVSDGFYIRPSDAVKNREDKIKRFKNSK